MSVKFLTEEWTSAAQEAMNGDAAFVAAMGDIDNPDATISQDYDTAKGISTGELSAVSAYMTGKLRVTGDLMKLMTMQGVLTQLPNALKSLDVEY